MPYYKGFSVFVALAFIAVATPALASAPPVGYPYTPPKPPTCNVSATANGSGEPVTLMWRTENAWGVRFVHDEGYKFSPDPSLPVNGVKEALLPAGTRTVTLIAFGANVDTITATTCSTKVKYLLPRYRTNKL